MRFLRRPAGTRLFFASDVHGSEQCFRKWLNAAAAYGVDALILGGDITGKAVVAVIETEDGWNGEVGGQQLRARNESELADLQRRIRDSGSYDLILSPHAARALESDPEALDKAFRKAVEERLIGWVRLADERLAGTKASCFMMLGNDDPPELADIIRQSSRIVYAEDGIQELPGGYELLSYGYSPPTPWRTPRELPENEIAGQLDSLAARLQNPTTAVFNLHCPPRGTHLDQAPELDHQLRPKSGLGGQSSGAVGSEAVRGILQRLQPLLGLHGHVHESAGAEKIGRTLCVNPGSEYSEGILRGVLVQLGSKGLESWQFVQG